MNGWRTMERRDWDGYAGTEPFFTGDEPVIREDLTVDGTPAVGFLDGNGAAVLVYFEDTNETTQYTAESLAAVAWLASRTDPALTDKYLLVAGFEKMEGL